MTDKLTKLNQDIHIVVKSNKKKTFCSKLHKTMDNLKKLSVSPCRGIFINTNYLTYNAKHKLLNLHK